MPKAISLKLGVDSLLGFSTEVSLNIANMGNVANITCVRGTSTHWTDQVKGGVVAATGNLNFAAVALQDGSLYVSFQYLCAIPYI